MKNKISLLFLFIISTAKAQHTEFTVYENGLIYSDTTVTQLKEIVDSLNLKFKSCDPTKKYYSKSQATGGYFYLKGDGAKDAMQYMEAGMPYSEIILKYPAASVIEEITVARFSYEDYSKNQVISFNSLSLNRNHEIKLTFNNQPNLYLDNHEKKWVFTYVNKDSYSVEYVKAFYFPSGFSSAELPTLYASMAQYGECMVDTNYTIYKEDSKNGYVKMPIDLSKLNEQEKKKLLDEMRGTRVVGMCSQDDSPRIHARNIAILAAETISWEIFLRAHLDIMNDRFDRMSDGSYAWEKRETYIKELEILDINIVDLIIGISLRIENPSENHYYGNIGRLGRAISESDYKDEFENTMLTMIKDDALDDYNRLIVYYLFLNYNSYIVDETEKNTNTELLNVALDMLPDYIKNSKEPQE